jgi:hypothetical protein
MVQIIKNPSFGENLGTALGGGLSGGLQWLAENKIKEMAQRHQMNQISRGLGALGIPQEQAQQLAGLPENVLREYTKQHLMAPSREAYAQSLQELLGGGAPQQQQGLAPMQPAAPGIEQQQPTGQLRLPVKPQLTEQQATKLAEFGLKKQAMTSKEKSEAYKATKEDRKEILQSAKDAKENITRLDRMSELSKTGKLDSPLYYNLLKKVGLDIPALLNPESQEFDKLATDFIKNSRSIFGGRITENQIETFLKTIPSLSQSAEGREAVTRNLKIMNEGALLRDKALREVLRENNGIPPLDLSERVNERVEPALSELSKEFVRGGKSTIEVGQSLNELPDAKLYKGAEIQDEETGTLYVSDGSSWKVKG